MILSTPSLRSISRSVLTWLAGALSVMAALTTPAQAARPRYAAFMVDANTREVLYANDRFATMVGMSGGSVLGTVIDSLFAPSQRDRLRQMLAQQALFRPYGPLLFSQSKLYELNKSLVGDCFGNSEG